MASQGGLILALVGMLIGGSVLLICGIELVRTLILRRDYQRKRRGENPWLGPRRRA